MLKDVRELEYTIGERVFRFSCDAQSPISEIHEALGNFSAFVVQIQKQHQARMASEATPAPAEAPIAKDPE